MRLNKISELMERYGVDDKHWYYMGKGKVVLVGGNRKTVHKTIDNLERRLKELQLQAIKRSLKEQEDENEG